MRLARCSRTSWLIAFFFRFERAETQKTIFGLSNQRLDKNRFLCNKKSWPEKTLEQKPKIAFPEHVMFLFFQNIHRNLTFEKKNQWSFRFNEYFKKSVKRRPIMRKNRLLEQNHLGCFWSNLNAGINSFGIGWDGWISEVSTVIQSFIWSKKTHTKKQLLNMWTKR